MPVPCSSETAHDSLARDHPAFVVVGITFGKCVSTVKYLF